MPGAIPFGARRISSSTPRHVVQWPPAAARPPRCRSSGVRAHLAPSPARRPSSPSPVGPAATAALRGGDRHDGGTSVASASQTPQANGPRTHCARCSAPQACRPPRRRRHRPRDDAPAASRRRRKRCGFPRPLIRVPGARASRRCWRWRKPRTCWQRRIAGARTLSPRCEWQEHRSGSTPAAPGGLALQVWLFPKLRTPSLVLFVRKATRRLGGWRRHAELRLSPRTHRRGRPSPAARLGQSQGRGGCWTG